MTSHAPTNNAEEDEYLPPDEVYQKDTVYAQLTPDPQPSVACDPYSPYLPADHIPDAPTLLAMDTPAELHPIWPPSKNDYDPPTDPIDSDALPAQLLCLNLN